MGDAALSQEEIDALMANTVQDFSDNSTNGILTNDEIDTVGEISNISMGSAATALFSLVNKKVDISTPVVSISNWEKIIGLYEKPCVLIKISYTKGLDGSNLLIMKENDVKVITNLMMGGDGTNVENMELGDMELSAISEAMNQMMGSAATSLSTMLGGPVDISPPQSDLLDLQDTSVPKEVEEYQTGDFVEIRFRLLIGDLVDSFIMQLYPIDVAKKLVTDIKNNMQADSNSTTADASGANAANAMPDASAGMSSDAGMAGAMPDFAGAAMQNNTMPDLGGMQSGYVDGFAGNGMPGGMQGANAMGAPMNQPMGGYGMPAAGMGQPQGIQNSFGAPAPQPSVSVQPAQFTPLSASQLVGNYNPENINLIMDVPLEVTVELGRTKKSIKEILDFTPGTIIELNRIAGEPIDVLVNGKYVAKGEVVVIEESFGIRITEIVK